MVTELKKEDYNKVSENKKVIELIKEIERLEKEISKIDDNALIKAGLIKLSY